MKKLVVIPTYNERDNIIELMKVALMVSPDSHLLVVDDGSPDGTGRLVEDFMAKEKRVFILKRKEKKGLGQAYVAGFHWGLQNGYDFLSEMDADWSHPPKFLVPMYNAAKNFDFVVGSRYVKGGGSVNWSFGRKLISRCGSIYSRIILGVPISDFTGGFNGWHAKVLKAVDLDTIASDGYSFQIELKYRAAKLGFTFTEIPLVFEERREGQSKMSAAIVREAIWRVWGLKFKRKALRVAKQENSDVPLGK
jgi:dolichol-phosphate mannosyltransferase